MYRRANLMYRVIDSFFRHRWMFAVSMLGVALVIATALLTRTKGFVGKASTYIFPNNEIDAIISRNNWQSNGWMTPAQRNTAKLGNLLRDNVPGGFVDKFLKRANVNIQIDPRVKDPLAEKLGSGLFINPDTDQTFTISLNWDKFDECERMVDAIQKQFIEEIGHEKISQNLAAVAFLQKELQECEGQMKRSETVLRDFKTRFVANSTEAATALIERHSALKLQLDHLRATSGISAQKVAVLHERLAKLNPTREAQRVRTVSPALLAIERLKLDRLQTLGANYLPSSTRVKNIDEQIAMLQKQVAQEKKRGGTGLDTITYEVNPEYETVRTEISNAEIDEKGRQVEIASLTQQVGTYEAKIKELPGSEQSLMSKTRDYDFFKNKYDTLRRQLDELRVKTRIEEVTAASQLQPLGVVYVEPMLGRKKQALMLLASLILGFIVGTILVVLKEWLDPTLRYEMDAERVLGVPVLVGLQENSSVLALPSAKRRTTTLLDL